MSYSTFINKQFIYAVIGVSLDTEKFGNRVFSYLIENDYKVFPINIRGGTILNSKIYKSINDIDKEIDVAVFVIPSKISEIVLKEVIQKGVKKVWFQPGSESLKSKKICEKNNVEFIMEECIMVENEKMKF